MLENWLRPISPNLAADLDLDKSRLGSKIQRFEDELPNLKNTQIALVGIGEEEANAVRRALYPLSFPFGKLKIADLGNVRKDEHSFLIPLLRELLEGRICPVVVGHAGKFVQAQFEAHHSLQSSVSLAVVDEKIAFHPRQSEFLFYYL